MSGAQFLHTLKELGYPGADSLDAQSLDWMFENRAIVPFLDWFSTNIHASNLLQPEELQQ